MKWLSNQRERKRDAKTNKNSDVQQQKVMVTPLYTPQHDEALEGKQHIT